MSVLEPIREFRGEHRFLSNFWPANVLLDGESYPTVEHAYQAAKTTDAQMRRRIRFMTAPGKVKKLGSGLALRPYWHQLKLTIMYELLKQKFDDSHPVLRDLLRDTGSRPLIEGNSWGDVFWGVCDGVGDNNLGKLLMRVRDEL